MFVLKTGLALAMTLGVGITIPGREATNSRRQHGRVSNEAGAPKLKLDIMRWRAADGDPAGEEGRYKAGDKIILRIQLTNISDEKLAVSVSDKYSENRPELVKGGRLVPYRKETLKLLEKRDKNLEFSRRDFVNLRPAETKEIGAVNLNDWYAPLDSGVYQLTIKYRSFAGTPWVASAPVSFEVVP